MLLKVHLNLEVTMKTTDWLEMLPSLQTILQEMGAAQNITHLPITTTRSTMNNKITPDLKQITAIWLTKSTRAIL